MHKIDIYTDGASRGNPGKSACSYVFVLDGNIIKFHSEYIGLAINNVAEYSALLLALKEALKDSYEELTVYSDSLLLISQIKGEYKVKSPNLKILNEEVLTIVPKFEKITFNHVGRENKFIKLADYLNTIILGPK
ncbi:MAG: ribonuclease HI family protein [Caldisericaceae bacterium]